MPRSDHLTPRMHYQYYYSIIVILACIVGTVAVMLGFSDINVRKLIEHVESSTILVLKNVQLYNLRKYIVLKNNTM